MLAASFELALLLIITITQVFFADACIYTTTYPSRDAAPMPRPPTTPKSTLQAADFITLKAVDQNYAAITTVSLEDVQFYENGSDLLIHKPQSFSGPANNIFDDDSTWVFEAGRLTYLYFSVNQSAGSPVTHIGIQLGIGDLMVWSVNGTNSQQAIYRGLTGAGQVVYELRFRVPAAACAIGSTTARSCAVMPLKAYAMWFTGSTGSLQAHAYGPYENFDVPLHCGSLCYAEPNSMCVYKTFPNCQTKCVSYGYQSIPESPAERNRQITRRYDVGVTTGNITLNYTTGVSKDRIIVYYENRAIHTTDCVATGDNIWVLGNLVFGGITTEIRVDVEPNCDGNAASYDAVDFKYWFEQIPRGLPTIGPCDK